MSAPPAVGAMLVSPGASTALNDPVVSHWGETHWLAAEYRLGLARRYQNQYDRLDAEFANLHASQSWLAAQCSEETAHLLLAYPEILAPYFLQRGLAAELLRWCIDGLQACEKLRRNCDQLLLLRGEAQIMLGRWDEAMVSIQATIQASKERSPSVHARAILALGRLQLNQGNYETALRTLNQVESLLSEQSDYEGLITARSEIAAYYLNRRELDKALSLYLQVDQLRRQLGATEPSDHTLLMLGVVHRKRGNLDQATAYLQHLLERGEARHDQRVIAVAAHHLAWVYLAQGKLTEARCLCGRAIELYKERGDIRGASDAHEQLGRIALAAGRGEEAVSCLEQSLALRRQLGNQHGAASSLRHLSFAYLRTGRVAAAARSFLQSLYTYWRLGMLNRRRLVVIGRELFVWTVGRLRWTT